MQAAPLKQQRKMNSTKMWTKGAPLSKKAKMPGIGRGKNPNSHGNKGDVAKEQRTTVPLPADREEVTVQCVRDFLVDPPNVGAENATPQWAQPPPMQPTQLPPIPVALAAE